jgi:hypothetical protein
VLQEAVHDLHERSLIGVGAQALTGLQEAPCCVDNSHFLAPTLRHLNLRGNDDAQRRGRTTSGMTGRGGGGMTAAGFAGLTASTGMFGQRSVSMASDVSVEPSGAGQQEGGLRESILSQATDDTMSAYGDDPMSNHALGLGLGMDNSSFSPSGAAAAGGGGGASSDRLLDLATIHVLRFNPPEPPTAAATGTTTADKSATPDPSVGSGGAGVSSTGGGSAGRGLRVAAAQRQQQRTGADEQVRERKGERWGKRQEGSQERLCGSYASDTRPV